MDVKALVQGFCQVQGLPVAQSVASSTDAQVAQIGQLLHDFVDDLLTRKFWQVATVEGNATSAGTEELATIDPQAVLGIVPDSMFDRTNQTRILGSMSTEDWQARKATNATGPFYQYYLRGNRILVSPVIPAGHAVYWEYYSPRFVVANDGTTLKQYWTQDNDTFRCNDALPRSWLKWRWKAQKGLEYAEDFAAYERLIDTFTLKQGGFRTVDLTCHAQGVKMGLVVPEGNWPLP
ncbi:MAG: hypothetical protein AB7U98_13580 [Candidatus Nitrosocosmicus sp.]